MQMWLQDAFWATQWCVTGQYLPYKQLKRKLEELSTRSGCSLSYHLATSFPVTIIQKSRKLAGQERLKRDCIMFHSKWWGRHFEFGSQHARHGKGLCLPASNRELHKQESARMTADSTKHELNLNCRELSQLAHATMPRFGATGSSFQPLDLSDDPFPDFSSEEGLPKDGTSETHFHTSYICQIRKWSFVKRFDQVVEVVIILHAVASRWLSSTGLQGCMFPGIWFI